MAELQGTVGVQTLSAGADATARLDKSGALVATPGAAPYYDLVARGIVFAASIPPGTGQAPGTAIGTTACFTLANAAGTATNLVILQINVGYISGTLGAGTLALLAHVGVGGAAITAPSSGTAITPTNALLNNTTVSVANCRFNNTVPASGLQIRTVCGLQASLASTAVAPWAIHDLVGGSVVVGPGSAVSVQGITAAGSSPLIVVGMVWAEVPQ
jgi:hypothetical protein